MPPKQLLDNGQSSAGVGCRAREQSPSEGMSHDSAASWPPVNRSLFKGSAACITLALIPSPPQAHVSTHWQQEGLCRQSPWAGAARLPPAQGPSLQGRREQGLFPSRCHTSHVKGHGGWIRLEPPQRLQQEGPITSSCKCSGTGIHRHLHPSRVCEGQDERGVHPMAQTLQCLWHIVASMTFSREDIPV